VSDYFDHAFIMNIVQGTHTKHTDKNNKINFKKNFKKNYAILTGLADAAIDLAAVQAAGATTASKSHLYWLTFDSDIYLANVNSLLSPVRLSVVCLSVALVHPTQAVEIFGNISMAIWYLGHPLTSTKNVTGIVPGEPLRRDVKHHRTSQI